MGNCSVVCRRDNVSCFGDAGKRKNRNIVQLVKIDGKMMEFSAPILVKDVLQNFSGYNNIGLSREALQHLPSNSRLKLGDRYYLIPSVESLEIEKGSPRLEKEEDGGVKRIKVVITRQQLQDLLSKQGLTVDILSGLKSEACSDDEKCMTIWKPQLESIPEEHETRSIF